MKNYDTNHKKIMLCLPCLFVPPIGFLCIFYMLAYMFVHESCLLVCRPSFNTMKLWTFNPNLHLSPVDTTFCLPSSLFACFLVSSHMLCLPYLSCLPALCLFHMILAPFPSIACLLVSCSCLCMCTHRARTHGAGARSPRLKQKG